MDTITLDTLIDTTTDDYEEEELRRLRLLVNESNLPLTVEIHPDDGYGRIHVLWKGERITRLNQAGAAADWVAGLIQGHALGVLHVLNQIMP